MISWLFSKIIGDISWPGRLGFVALEAVNFKVLKNPTPTLASNTSLLRQFDDHG